MTKEEALKAYQNYKDSYTGDNIQNGYLAHYYPYHEPYGACPHCGYCPHCGRGGHRFYPDPYYQQPIITCGGIQDVGTLTGASEAHSGSLTGRPSR